MIIVKPKKINNMRKALFPKLIVSLIFCNSIFLASFSQDGSTESIIQAFNVVQIQKMGNYTTKTKMVIHEGKVVMQNGKVIVVKDKEFNCKHNVANFNLSAQSSGKKKMQVILDYDLTFNLGHENATLQDSIVYIAFCLPTDSLLINIDIVNSDIFSSLEGSNMLKEKGFDKYPTKQQVKFNIKFSDLIPGEYRVKLWLSECLISEYYFTYE